MQLRHLVKSYDRTVVALDDVSIDVVDGEFLAVIGPSGCGKSTLLRVIAGLEAVTSGEVIIDGQVVNRVRSTDRNMALVSQDFALYPHLSVFDNIAFPLRRGRRISDHEVEERVREACRTLEIEGLTASLPRTLTGGQRQRVALGRAIVRDPRVFLFDEPLANLEQPLRTHMRSEIAWLQRRMGVTTVYVTHDQMDALRLGDRVAVLDEGKVQQIASPRELLDNPANLFVAGFIGTPAMSFVPAVLRGDLVNLPFGLVRMNADRLSRVQAGGTFIAGVRPEYVDDGDAVSDDDHYIHIVDSGQGVPQELVSLEHEMAKESVGTRLVASVEAEGLMPPGRSSQVYVDTRKIHLFDPASGVNLTLPED